MNRFSLTVVFSLCLLAGNIFAQDYKGRIKLLQAAIDIKLTDHKTGLYFETTDSSKNENLHSWLWPLCALIQATNEQEVLDPSKKHMAPVVKAIDQYYNIKPPVPAYQDYVTSEKLSSRFYDDNQWVAIAYLDAYNRNHGKKYLEVSKMIWRFIENGTDTVAGGGVYWKEGDLTTKNACSNGPGALVALQLYKITKEKHYLQSAIAIYNWTNKNLQAPDGVFYDHIKLPSREIAKAQFTYNTGAMLQSAVLLYEITKDKKYLDEAKRVAAAGRERFFKNGRLTDKNYWFNAVMLRGYQELYRIDRQQKWVDFYMQDAEAIWNTERDADNLVGRKAPKRLIDQAAMIEIYARLEQIKNPGK